MSIRIPHAAITRAPGLLPMQYTLVELATELGLSARTLREWVSNTDLTVPHQRDGRGHIWIEGRVAGTCRIGEGNSNSFSAQVKNADRATQILRSVFAESG
jgi:hypothetical protein